MATGDIDAPAPGSARDAVFGGLAARRRVRRDGRAAIAAELAGWWNGPGEWASGARASGRPAPR